MRLPALLFAVSFALLLSAACGGEVTLHPDTPTSLPPTSPGVEAGSTSIQPGDKATPTPTPTATPEAPPAQIPVGYRIGQRAPDFAVTTVDGEEVTLAHFQGRPVLLYFFATW